MRRTSKTVAALCVLVAAALGSTATSGAGSRTCSDVLAPAYFRDEGLWTAGSSLRSRGLFVLNPASGPGTAPDPVYRKAVRRARRAGMGVVGYVSTDYGRRDLTAVKADIRRYSAWYGTGGVFLDEAAGSTRKLRFYRSIARHIRSTPGRLLILNPGVVPARGYMDVADIVVTFEGPASAYKRAGFPSWTRRYAATRFANLVYSAARPALMERVIRLARSRNVGNVYVTDDRLPNPWDRLPSYFKREQATLRTSCRRA